MTTGDGGAKDATGTILHLSTVHSRDDVRVYTKMCRSAAEAGHRVVLVAPPGPVPADDDVEHVSLPATTGVWGRLVRLQAAAWTAVRRLNPDIVHLHDPELLPLGVALRMSGLSVIFDAHENVAKQVRAKYWVPKVLRWPLSFVVGLVMGMLSRLVSHVVAASEPIRRSFPETRSSVVRNLPRLAEFDDSRATGGPGADDHETYVTYVGGLTEVRGISELVTAMEMVEHPNVRLALAGRFAPEEFERSVRAQDGWTRTEMFGWLDRGGIADLLHRSRLGLVVVHPAPNHMEGMPIKLFEYMAAGLPVVMSDFPHFRELAEGVSLFVDPCDPADIARAVDWVLAHPDDAREMGALARRRVERELNWEQESRKLLDLYDELLAARR